MKKQMMTALPETADKTTLVSMTVNGSTATIIGTNYATGPFVDTHGKYGKKGAHHQFASAERERTRWVKQGDIWKVASVRILSEKDMVDGKPVHS